MGLALHSFSQALRLLAKRKVKITPLALGASFPGPILSTAAGWVAVLFSLDGGPPVQGTTDSGGGLRGRRGPGVLCMRNFLKNPLRFV